MIRSRRKIRRRMKGKSFFLYKTALLPEKNPDPPPNLPLYPPPAPAPNPNLAPRANLPPSYVEPLTL